MKYTYDYTRLLVNDFAACFRFYRDILEFTPRYGDEQSVYAEFESGAVTLALFDRKAMADALGDPSVAGGGAGADRVTLIFAVPHVDDAFRELQGKGVSFVAEPTDRPEWTIRTAHFRDPDGNLIEINTPLAS
jgi:catechol 2,3-dioxygenase-like lactoylglutathione lyase family enzyme